MRTDQRQHTWRVITAMLTILGGVIIATSSASADMSCPNDTVCTWLGPNFTGDKNVFNAGVTESAHDLGDHRHLVRSWRNAAQHHWWLSDRLEGTEYVLLQCLAPGTAQADVNSVLITPRADSLFRLDTCLL